MPCPVLVCVIAVQGGGGGRREAGGCSCRWTVVFFNVFTTWYSATVATTNALWSIAKFRLLKYEAVHDSTRYLLTTPIDR
jgi:hypothetical protein